MAEKANQQETPPASSPLAHSQKPMLFVYLAIFNMFVVISVGTMIYMGNKQKASEQTIQPIINSEAELLENKKNNHNFIGKSIPLETFLVNLSGSNGRKLAKINMELEVNKNEVQEEIDQLKPKIRDIIIMILSSKSYSDVSSTDGKDVLRKEIKNQVNLFLTKGQIKKVYFTEFIFN